MKVKITKTQDKGMLSSNVTFKVKAQVEISDEERNLIKHYNIGGITLLERKKKNIFGELTNDIIKITVNDFTIGQVFSCKDLGEIISFKENIKEATINLKNILAVARNFEGEETFEV